MDLGFFDREVARDDLDYLEQGVFDGVQIGHIHHQLLAGGHKFQFFEADVSVVEQGLNADVQVQPRQGSLHGRQAGVDECRVLGWRFEGERGAKAQRHFGAQKRELEGRQRDLKFGR